MRVSSNQVYTTALKAIETHAAEVTEYQRQLSSGLRYAKASDSVLAAGLGVQVTLDSNIYDMYEEVQRHGEASLATTDTLLSNIGNLLMRFQNLMVQAGSSSVGVEGRASIADELKVIEDSVTQFSNTKNSNGTTILTSSQLEEVEVAPNVFQKTSITRDSIMTITSLGKALDTVGAVDGILATAMKNIKNGSAPSDEDFNNISESIKQLQSKQTEVGGLQNKLTSAKDATDAQRLNLTSERASILDADMVGVATELARSNALLQAAQMALSKMNVDDLFSKL